MHAAQIPLLLTSAVGVPAAGLRLAYAVTTQEKTWARSTLEQRMPARHRPLVGFQVASFQTKAFRDWPLEHFAALAQRVLEQWPHGHFLLFDFDFDLGVTAEAPQDVIIGPEPPQCIERPSYPYCAINVGVIFVRNSPRLLPLLEAWIREMDSVQHLSIEQTALANLIYRLAPDFFEAHYRKHELVLGGGERVSVMTLPMQLYNFTKIRRSDTSLGSEAFVAHFCGGKKQAQHWEWVHQMIEDQLRSAGGP